MTVRRDRDATRSKLLAAARDAFATDGYAGASVRSIARVAGVDAALIFRYFGSKDGLFVAATAADDPAAMLDLPASELATALLRMVAFPPGPSPIPALLRSTGRGAGERRLQATVCDPYVAALAGPGASADAELRAELAVATILGIALMRGFMPTTRLSKASQREIEEWFERCIAALGMNVHAVRAPAGVQ
jgi:AcrR family transcriptional regulator